MNCSIRIGERTICNGGDPLVIAEMSGNHNQSLDTAMAIVQAAADAGADAVKLQTYTADTITLDVRSGPFVITDKNSPWVGRKLYELYQEWAIVTRERIMSAREFRAAMRKRGYKTKHKRSGTHFLGLELGRSSSDTGLGACAD